MDKITFKIINGVTHQILHEFGDNEYIIILQENIFYWRPNLTLIGSEYMDISEVQKMILKLENDKRKWRSKTHRYHLLNLWKTVHQIIREYRIEEVLKPESDNFYILAC